VYAGIKLLFGATYIFNEDIGIILIAKKDNYLAKHYVVKVFKYCYD